MVCHRPLAVRQKRQVLAQHIDSDRRKHEKQADPDASVTMRAFPVRKTLDRIAAVAIRTFVPVVTVIILIHRFCTCSKAVVMVRWLLCSFPSQRQEIVSEARSTPTVPRNGRGRSALSARAVCREPAQYLFGRPRRSDSL